MDEVDSEGLSVFLYLTADRVGIETGGGIVTKNESDALKSLGPCEVWDRDRIAPGGLQLSEPWGWDEALSQSVGFWFSGLTAPPKLVHGYAGSFPKTIRALKDRGVKVVWTVAAHDKDVSREEHEKLGIGFPYPHLVQPDLWQRYIEGYRLADVIVAPGTVPAETIRGYGPEFRDKRIEVIPHGCALPEDIRPLPHTFVVGYLGSFGLDKGVRYLMEAWKKLDYDDSLLVLAGGGSTAPSTRQMWSAFGGGNVRFLGWVRDVADFYSQITLYVQPSATEGFGIEVAEAMAHGRPVICSEGAGAVDLVPPQCRVRARDAQALVGAIDWFKNDVWETVMAENWQQYASKVTWDRVRGMYANLWKSLL